MVHEITLFRLTQNGFVVIFKVSICFLPGAFQSQGHLLPNPFHKGPPPWLGRLNRSGCLRTQWWMQKLYFGLKCKSRSPTQFVWTPALGRVIGWAPSLHQSCYLATTRLSALGAQVLSIRDDDGGGWWGKDVLGPKALMREGFGSCCLKAGDEARSPPELHLSLQQSSLAQL